MPEMIRVKPKTADATVRNPDRGHRMLAAEGELVPRTAFWERRLAAGDVVEAPAPAVPAQADPAAPEPDDPAPAALTSFPADAAPDEPPPAPRSAPKSS